MGLDHQSLVSPCHSLFPFLSFSLCSSFRMAPWNTGDLLAFCVNQGRSSLFLSLLTFLITYAIIPKVPLDPAGARPWHCKIRNKKRVSTFTTITQHSSGSPSYSNQRRKKNKRNPDRKRSKTLTICR